MFEIDITPLVNVGLELLAGALLAIGSWAVSRLAGKIGIEMDDKARVYVREAVSGGIEYALKTARNAGKDLGVNGGAKKDHRGGVKRDHLE